MTILVGSPALRLLARRKLRGTVRRQLRRLKTPKGAILTGLGVVLFCLWIGSIVLHLVLQRRPTSSEIAVDFVRVGCLALTLLSISSALVHRGLYLPKGEIERLFSAPIERSDLIRYRLLVNFGRSLFGSIVLGLVVMRRMPSPALAFLGVFVAVQTLPVLNQLLAILAGGLERRIVERVRSLRFVVVVLVGLLVGVLVFTIMADRNTTQALERVLPQGLETVFPRILTAISLPLEPWVRMIMAPDLASFLPWFVVCLGLGLLLVETAARLPIDFRELSLATSASVAARLRRARRSGGAAASTASRRAAGWRIPWLFGRGPAGALAWRKTASIVRKAKGTIWVSALVLAFVTILSSFSFRGERDADIIAPALIATLGTLYLCAGLRFDFRDELDRMDQIKAWPVPPRHAFAAMILPEVCLVSVLLMSAVFIRALMSEHLAPVVVAIILLLPLLVFAWVALDNAVFLFAPVRFVPGQDGALQNAGRGLVMMLLRMLLLAVVLLMGGGAAFATFFLAYEVGGVAKGVASMLAAVAVWGVLFLVDLGLVWLGGVTFKRFDVARDR